MKHNEHTGIRVGDDETITLSVKVKLNSTSDTLETVEKDNEDM